jgi:hypothetical protein
VRLPRFSFLQRAMKSLCQAAGQHLHRWTRPQDQTPALTATINLTCSKSELVLERTLLHQQLVILKPQVKRPALNLRNQTLLVLLKGCGRGDKRWSSCSLTQCCAGTRSCFAWRGDTGLEAK